MEPVKRKPRPHLAKDRARNDAADSEFGTVREDARPVDVANVIAAIDWTISPGTAFHTNIANDSAKNAFANVRARLTDGRSNLNNFEAIQRLAMSQIWRNLPHNRGRATKLGCFGGFCINSINHWKTQVKDFFKQIVTFLKLRVTLKPYRQAVRRQRADEARISSPHIRHFGLRHRPRFARDM